MKISVLQTAEQQTFPSRFAAGGGGAKYSRLDAEVSAMQRNSSTYCDEPEDAADYAAWLAAFDLTARKPDIDAIIAENAFMAELQARIVPLIVQYEEFWTRYFYQCGPTSPLCLATIPKPWELNEDLDCIYSDAACRLGNDCVDCIGFLECLCLYVVI